MPHNNIHLEESAFVNYKNTVGTEPYQSLLSLANKISSCAIKSSQSQEITSESVKSELTASQVSTLPKQARTETPSSMSYSHA